MKSLWRLRAGAFERAYNESRPKSKQGLRQGIEPGRDRGMPLRRIARRTTSRALNEQEVRVPDCELVPLTIAFIEKFGDEVPRGFAHLFPRRHETFWATEVGIVDILPLHARHMVQQQRKPGVGLAGAIRSRFARLLASSATI